MSQAPIISEFNPCHHNNVEQLLTDAILNDYWQYIITELGKRPDILSKPDLERLLTKRRLLTQFKVENESYISSKKLK
jgi:hypothetical protein